MGRRRYNFPVIKEAPPNNNVSIQHSPRPGTMAADPAVQVPGRGLFLQMERNEAAVLCVCFLDGKGNIRYNVVICNYKRREIRR
ncbi:hypothetical protein DXA14_24530 [Hungatella hathewayi]|nr:hypothetical protein DXA14_24530 [Hungatella hathewayi]RHB63349.1 hypothetical protein DW876_27820 [Hungatella hathewayi]